MLSDLFPSVVLPSLLRLWLFAYDVLTLPVSLLVYRPWARRRLDRKVRARIVHRTGSSVTVEPLPQSCSARDEILSLEAPLDTLDKVWSFAVRRGGRRECLGTRECFAEEPETQPDGKVFVKLVQGEYKWQSYDEVDVRASDFARGLRALCDVSPRQKVAVYADSRAEWMLAAAACFKSAVGIVTLYTNLGEDDVAYGIRQTRVETVVTSQELLPKLFRVLEKREEGGGGWTAHVKNVVYFESRVSGKKPEAEETSLRVLPFLKVEDRGRQMRESGDGEQLEAPKPDDLAVLMYTSGSTGRPKGALLTHGQLAASVVACLVGACDLMGEERRPDEEAYLAYLPMAHIFELTHEIIVMILGIRIGYSGPNTLTDAGTMVKSGQKGDASVLKPTVMIAVPLILERIHSALRRKILARGRAFAAAFEVAYRYRLFWTRRGCDTPVLNRMLFDRFRAALGGKIEVLVGGGAPLAGEVHDFLRTCLRVTLAQGYGLTETAGGVTLADKDDLSTGRVGRPLQGVRVTLEDWQEGGYTTGGPGRPSGEIVIGCPWVAAGYFEMPEATAEGFSAEEEGGLRWFRTGDVGELMPDGTFRIVDRKKDLVKLQLGEYVSLGKIESCARLVPAVESVCAHADPTKSRTVALVVPSEEEIRKLHGQIYGKGSNGSSSSSIDAANGVVAEQSGGNTQDPAPSYDQLCADPKIVEGVFKQIRSRCVSCGLSRHETPSAVELVSSPPQWTPDTGLVTAAMKLRRRQIQKRYQANLDRMYARIEESVS